METDIRQFYKNKNIFLTGGTGFLGKVFIEKTLRVCDVQYIYLLIRPKRGKTIKERIDDIFKESLFETLLKQKPNAAEHVLPIVGDCVLPNMGLSDDDRQTLIENVDVVVHSAATVRFNEPLSVAFDINVRATLDLIQLSKQMKKLQAFVHVSSAFANCLQTHIEERSYTDKLNISATKLCDLASGLGPKMFNSVSNALCEPFPNTYTYTKAIAEEAILTEGKDLPICIFRPGIVIQTCSEPVPGWIDNLYGPTSILYGSAYGVLRVMYLRREANAAVVPVDYCANMMLACGWQTATTVHQEESSTPTIYNLVPEDGNMLKWGEYIRSVEEYAPKMPLSQMIWFPFLITTFSKFYYKLLCFFYHTLPGYIIDFALLLLGRKRHMVKTYRKIHKQMDMLDYFTVRNWTFTNENSKQLWQSMTNADRQLFAFDMRSIDWHQYFYNSLLGVRRYLSKEGPDTIPKAQKLFMRLEILHRTVQLLVCSGGAALLWSIVKVVAGPWV